MTEPPTDDVIFAEFFAGDGGLSREVARLGVPTWQPDDLATGGVDFSDGDAVAAVKRRLEDWKSRGASLILHFAPPCSTFSRARDRSRLTRLRSPEHPEGLPGMEAEVAVANKIAENTLELAEWAAVSLDAVVTIENPGTSYLWEFWGPSRVKDVLVDDLFLSQCCFGTPYRKNTRLRCYGKVPSKLGLRCVARGLKFSCGASRQRGHAVLEFGGENTKAAAAYPRDLCRAWAKEVVSWRCELADRRVALAGVDLTTEGRKVKRHRLRGPTLVGNKELKEDENQKCLAGMRNPASVLRAWPSLVPAMAELGEFLKEKIEKVPSFQGLSGCCGAEPSRPPPSETLLDLLRNQVEEILGLPRGAGKLHHPAAPWRYEIIKAVQQACDDPDVVLPVWLADGAPMGLTCPIEPGGLFPTTSDDSELALDELAAQERWTRNHPSFVEPFGRDRPPGLDLLEEYLEDGFGELFKDAAAASDHFQVQVHPAPLATIGKERPDGTWKFRIIQDMRRNMVNSAVRLPERQVLPRPLDYAKDLALHSRSVGRGEVTKTLILDFANAFMSVPIKEQERPFNCTVADEALTRKRAPLREGEVDQGCCLVWRVLGFGGKPNPLIYSRVASFAARTAQAIIGHPNRRLQRGCSPRGRLQLYVDDPVVSMSGTELEIERSFDLIILWWLVLGVPLSWKKGSVVDARVRHTWIGVDFDMKDDGIATMRLPDKFAEDLVEQLAPFCSDSGHSARKAAEVVVGRVSRVAQVVPEARPFSTAMWAALTESDKAARSDRREAPPGRVPNRRFSRSARWVRSLLRGSEDSPFLLERPVFADGPRPASMSAWAVATDASPWGGGAVLLHNGVPMEFASWIWNNDQVKHLDVCTGDPAHQTFWEFFCLALALTIWGKDFVAESLAVLCDNTAALQNLLDLKGSGVLVEVALELAWRKARGRWSFAPGHLPSQQNTLADALSRLAAPEQAERPSELDAAVERPAPDPMKFWRLRA